jgi:hypothetical protein
MSAALNSVKPLKRHLKLVYFIVKSSCYSSQIKDVLKSAAANFFSVDSRTPHALIVGRIIDPRP